MPVDQPTVNKTRSYFTVFVIALSSLFVLAACRAEPSIVTSSAARNLEAIPQTGDESPATGDAATDDSPESDPDDPDDAVTGDADGAEDTAEAAAESESDPEDADTSAAEPLYEVQGVLPLTVADVNGLIEFIQDETGRDFLRPPVIVAQSTDEFVASLEENVVEFEDVADVTVRNLQAMGLTTKGVSEVSDAFLNLLTSPEGIQGYYDPEADELYVPIDALGDDDFRSLLVHELTHALDGQHADLGRLEELADEAEITGEYEPVVGLQAVGEGRATSVQNRWMRENSVPQPDATDLDLLSVAAVPPAMVLSLSVPYAFGEQYIEGLGGAANTWELLDTPPTSSEEFMVPGTSGETVIDVATPSADGPILDEADFGAVDLFVWMLGESLEPQANLIFPTFTAIDGWAGGRSVMWGDESESCVRITIVADSDDDLAEIEEILAIWAGDSADRSVEVNDSRVTVTGCAPYVP